MPTSLPVPTTSFVEQDIPINGINLTFTFKYNSREDRWRFDIFEDETPLSLGVKVVENINLTESYPLQNKLAGDIWCFRFKETKDQVGFDNLGIGKEYELVYLTKDEEEGFLNG